MILCIAFLSTSVLIHPAVAKGVSLNWDGFPLGVNAKYAAKHLAIKCDRSDEKFGELVSNVISGNNCGRYLDNHIKTASIHRKGFFSKKVSNIFLNMEFSYSLYDGLIQNFKNNPLYELKGPFGNNDGCDIKTENHFSCSLGFEYLPVAGEELEVSLSRTEFELDGKKFVNESTTVRLIKLR